MNRKTIAWVLILVVDALYIVWGGAAALSPEHLPGPGGLGILPAAFHGYTGGSWSDLATATPLVAGYIRVMYRMYGIYCALFGVMGSVITVTAFRRGERWAWWTLLVANTVALISAMAMDKMSNAIGPFEVTEYIGLLMVWVAFAISAPFHRAARPMPAIA